MPFAEVIHSFPRPFVAWGKMASNFQLPSKVMRFVNDCIEKSCDFASAGNDINSPLNFVFLGWFLQLPRFSSITPGIAAFLRSAPDMRGELIID